MRAVELFLELMTKGGRTVMVPIFCAGVLVWYIGVGRLLFLYRISRMRRRFMDSLDAVVREGSSIRFGLPAFDRLGEQLRVCTRTGAGPGAVRQVFREFLVYTIPELERGFSAMTAWITVAPLLGLLGTVMGMVHTFRVITLFGVGNPSLMAEGISIALVTTEAGLIVAFPAMLFHNHLVSRKNRVKAQLLRDGESLVNRFAPGPSRPPAQESSHV